MIRRTKVVATLGPASSDAKTLTRMIEAGLDVVRINFSHGAPDEHRARVNLVRQLARKAGRAVGVLVDLQGPKMCTTLAKLGNLSGIDVCNGWTSCVEWCLSKVSQISSSPQTLIPLKYL